MIQTHFLTLPPVKNTVNAGLPHDQIASTFEILTL